MSLPVTRSSGRALLVGSAASRGPVFQSLQQLGFVVAEIDDPYSAMIELCRHATGYQAVVLSLAGLYREELAIIPAIKRRQRRTEVWLAQTDGRQAALAEAMRLGADGLLADDGLHRIALGERAASEQSPIRNNLAPDQPAAAEVSASAEPSLAEVAPRIPPADEPDHEAGEPILSADELRALLQEQTSMPPAGEEL